MVYLDSMIVELKRTALTAIREDATRYFLKNFTAAALTRNSDGHRY